MPDVVAATPTPQDTIDLHVLQAVESFHQHVVTRGMNPGEAFAVVVSARAPYPENDVVAAIVRAVTEAYDRAVGLR